jgi:L-cystine uptake protein TcyP (sodium:dicarboxylate symporter family)
LERITPLLFAYNKCVSNNDIRGDSLKKLIITCHALSIVIGGIVSIIETHRILKVGKQIKWTSIVGGFFVMLWSLLLVLWHKQTTLKELKG